MALASSADNSSPKASAHFMVAGDRAEADQQAGVDGSAAGGERVRRSWVGGVARPQFTCRDGRSSKGWRCWNVVAPRQLSA